MGITHPDLSKLLHIVISLPPNNAWLERSNRLLKIIRQKRKNRLSVDSIEGLFFLGSSSDKSEGHTFIPTRSRTNK